MTREDDFEKVKFIPVLITFSPSKIAFVKSLLNSNKVSYYIDNENASRMADISLQMTVMVIEEQSKFAEELLKNVE